jgi:hypothetical protein
MALRSGRFGVILLACAALVPLQAATVSRQHAETFAKKIAQIQQHAVVQPQGSGGPRLTTRRTPVTEDEVNSWFMYAAAPMLPLGVTQPQVDILGDGRVVGQATVDLEAIGKRRSRGGSFDPWSYLGGRVPVSVEGILHTEDGRARFDVQTAEISGVPVPKAVLQELVSYYSRTPENPAGLSLDQAFVLPANIRQIEVGQGQAIVIQ